MFQMKVVHSFFKTKQRKQIKIVIFFQYQIKIILICCIGPLKGVGAHRLESSEPIVKIDTFCQPNTSTYFTLYMNP